MPATRSDHKMVPQLVARQSRKERSRVHKTLRDTVPPEFFSLWGCPTFMMGDQQHRAGPTLCPKRRKAKRSAKAQITAEKLAPRLAPEPRHHYRPTALPSQPLYVFVKEEPVDCGLPLDITREGHYDSHHPKFLHPSAAHVPYEAPTADMPPFVHNHDDSPPDTPLHTPPPDDPEPTGHDLKFILYRGRPDAVWGETIHEDPGHETLSSSLARHSFIYHNPLREAKAVRPRPDHHRPDYSQVRLPPLRLSCNTMCTGTEQDSGRGDDRAHTYAHPASCRIIHNLPPLRDVIPAEAFQFLEPPLASGPPRGMRAPAMEQRQFGRIHRQTSRPVSSCAVY